MQLNEVVFLSLFIGGLLAPAYFIQQWWLFATFAIFFVIFGLVELVAVIFTKKTVSQHFWSFSKENKKAAIFTLISMQIAWFALLWHLACKIL